MDLRQLMDGFARWFGYDSWDWGATADWVSGLGTFAAFALALKLLFDQRRDKKQRYADEFVTWYDLRALVDPTGLDREVRFSGANAGKAPISVASIWIRKRQEGPRGKVSYKTIEWVVLRVDGKVAGTTVIKEGETGTHAVLLDQDTRLDDLYYSFKDGNNKRWVRKVTDEDNRYLTRRQLKAINPTMFTNIEVRGVPSGN